MTIPKDILATLGVLTEKQQGVMVRLLENVGPDQARALVAAAQQRLTRPPTTANTPTTVRGMLVHMIQTDLPSEQRNVILNIQGQPTPLPPELHDRWQALCTRLNETERKPTRLLRSLIETIGIDLVEAGATEAEQVEAQGGMLLADGSRRRTLGGVFFYRMHHQLTPEQQMTVFGRVAKPPGSPGMGQATASAPAADLPLPERPAFVWAERKDLYQDLGAERGQGRSVKVILMGRPGKVIEKQDIVITSITVSTKASLPRGVPGPLPTTYSVYIGRKQWQKVKAAIHNPDDSLIVEGFACYDPDMEGILVSANNVTTRLLQQAKKQATAAEG